MVLFWAAARMRRSMTVESVDGVQDWSEGGPTTAGGLLDQLASRRKRRALSEFAVEDPVARKHV
jgi:hypothetical protein